MTFIKNLNHYNPTAPGPYTFTCRCCAFVLVVVLGTTVRIPLRKALKV